MNKRFLLKALTATVLGTAVSFAMAQETRTIKVGLQNPKGHPLVTGAEKFAELVEKNSNGKIKVNLFPGGVLGGDQQTVSAVQGGTVEMTILNSGILASQVKDFAVYDFPFLFANPKEADSVVDGPFGKNLHAKLTDKGIVGLGYYELGFRNMTNSKRPLTKVDDIAGLKLRVIPNPINVDWVKALGANPTPLPFPEVYAALEQKAIDGQENPFSVVLANKLFEVQKYLAITNHQYNPQSVIFSKKVWDSLSAAEKKIIQDAVNESSKYQRQVNRDAAKGTLDDLKKAGMTVTEFSPAEQAKFREKMKPVIDKHAANVGEDTVKAIMAELTKLRKK
jgi:TRAP-type transport system periplasmic protein